MDKLMQRVLSGEPVKGMLGMGTDDEGALHVIFQEEGSDEVMEEVIPAYMLAMVTQFMG